MERPFFDVIEEAIANIIKETNVTISKQISVNIMNEAMSREQVTRLGTLYGNLRHVSQPEL